MRVEIANLKGPRGFRGPRGLPASDPLPTDESVAEYLRASDVPSETFQALREVAAIMGPMPSGGDDTDALQAAILEAQATSGILRLHEGVYNHTGLHTLQEFEQPNIVGAGAQYTTLNNTAGSGSGIKFVGGSAGFSGGGLHDMSVTGAGTVGVEIEGACGLRINRVWFRTLAVGVLFHNAKSGDFSEQNVIVGSKFEASCTRWIEYRVTGGNVSFHGSGFWDCQFNTAPSDTAPKILIGANVLIYNAPFDGWMWTYGRSAGLGGLSLVDVSALNKRVFTYGHLRVEAFGSNLTYLTTDFPTGYMWSHAGDVSVLGETFRLNRRNTSAPFALVDRVLSRADSSVSRQRKPALSEWDLGTGATPTFVLDNAESSLVSVQISAPNYEYEYLLSVYRNAGDGGGSATVVSNGRSFNSAGYGAPSFSVSGGALVISNASYPSSGVTARVNVAEISPRGGLL